MTRAYSLVSITKADEDQRVIEGIASTFSTDRVGDQVDPMGARFKLPLPLLWQHDASKPIGQVEWAQPTPKGIPFRARIAKTDEPGPLRDRLQEAFQSIRIGLVRAVSIGFRPIKSTAIATGYRFDEWDWFELSAVTIPANEEATIATVKRYAGRPSNVVRLADPVGIAGAAKASRIVRLSDEDRARARMPIVAATLDAVERYAGKSNDDVLARSQAALAVAADREMAAVRARLDRLERGNA